MEKDINKLTKITNQYSKINKKINEYGIETKSLQNDIRSIINNIFGEYVDQNDHHLCDKQIVEFDKCWSFLAASMLRVKHTVLLPKFHYKENICINNTYGFKIHRKCCRWSPFQWIGTHRSNFANKFIMNKKGIFYINYSTEYLVFSVLQSIPQLDQAKVKRIYTLTKDIINMLYSWQNFYKKENEKISSFKYKNQYEYIKQIGDSYSPINSDLFIKIVPNIPEIIEWKESLIKDTKVQENKWQKIIDAWKEETKNYKVLASLSKRTLKI